jgi:hypothetical protein
MRLPYPLTMIFPDEAPDPGSFKPQLMQRRTVLGMLSLTSLGMLTSAAAASPGKSSSSVPKISVPTSSGNRNSRPALQYAPVSDLPEEWTIQHGEMANHYLRYLNSLGLQRVSPMQVLESHAKAKGSVWNSLPPKVWWKRMGYTLKVVDRIAREMNVHEVEIISAYRSPAYNAQCAGARAGSWHQANIAADVKFPVRASQVAATARELRNLGLFRGGVGGYWNFTHIDARGQNIDW